MSAFTATPLCPKGHASSTADYCSECGRKIQSTPAGNGASADSADATQVCPDCGTSREQSGIVFCEVCGFNFETGAHGEIGLVPAASSELTKDTLTEETLPAPFPQRWQAIILVDDAQSQSEGGPESPADFASWTFPLGSETCLLGRRDDARAIFPEIALPFDEAVSRRHALLQPDGASGWLLRDIGSANGTQLNGTELEAMKDYPLHHGDVIALGHWTRIRIEAGPTQP